MNHTLALNTSIPLSGRDTIISAHILLAKTSLLVMLNLEEGREVQSYCMPNNRIGQKRREVFILL